jgi:hypothetical protein
MVLRLDGDLPTSMASVCMSSVYGIVSLMPTLRAALQHTISADLIWAMLAPCQPDCTTCVCRASTTRTFQLLSVRSRRRGGCVGHVFGDGASRDWRCLKEVDSKVSVRRYTKGIMLVISLLKGSVPYQRSIGAVPPSNDQTQLEGQ